MMLMERDALWIGETRVFPPWYHKTVRLRESHSPEATTWVDFMVGTTANFQMQGYQGGRIKAPGSRIGRGIPPQRIPPGFPSGCRDDTRRAFIFNGAGDGHWGSSSGHNCSGDPARDFGYTVKQVFGFYLVTADPQLTPDSTGVIR